MNANLLSLKKMESVQNESSQFGELVACRPYSAHPADHYLSMVLVRRPNGSHVTWIFNHSAGGLNCGRYDQTLDEAIADFNDRTNITAPTPYRLQRVSGSAENVEFSRI